MKRNSPFYNIEAEMLTLRGEGTTDFGHIPDHFIARGGICVLESDIISRAWPEWKTVRRIGRGSYGIVYEAVLFYHC